MCGSGSKSLRTFYSAYILHRFYLSVLLYYLSTPIAWCMSRAWVRLAQGARCAHRLTCAIRGQAPYMCLATTHLESCHWPRSAKTPCCVLCHTPTRVGFSRACTRAATRARCSSAVPSRTWIHVRASATPLSRAPGERAALELDPAVLEREERVVAPDADVLAWLVLGARAAA